MPRLSEPRSCLCTQCDRPIAASIKTKQISNPRVLRQALEGFGTKPCRTGIFQGRVDCKRVIGMGFVNAFPAALRSNLRADVLRTAVTVLKGKMEAFSVEGQG